MIGKNPLGMAVSNDRLQTEWKDHVALGRIKRMIGLIRFYKKHADRFGGCYVRTRVQTHSLPLTFFRKNITQTTKSTIHRLFICGDTLENIVAGRFRNSCSFVGSRTMIATTTTTLRVSRLFIWMILALLSFTQQLTTADAFPISSPTSHLRSVKERRGNGYPKPTDAFPGLRQSNKNNHNPLHNTMLKYAFRPQDNLFAGIAEIGMGFSVGVLYSEYSILLTKCGPPDLSDFLERICYQGVIVYAGLALFLRIVTGNGLEATAENCYGPLLTSTRIQLNIAEILSFLAVLGAVVVLVAQTKSGVSMDGLSGIDINFCRAVRGDM